MACLRSLLVPVVALGLLAPAAAQATPAGNGVNGRILFATDTDGPMSVRPDGSGLRAEPRLAPFADNGATGALVSPDGTRLLGGEIVPLFAGLNEPLPNPGADNARWWSHDGDEILEFRPDGSMFAFPLVGGSPRSVGSLPTGGTAGVQPPMLGSPTRPEFLARVFATGCGTQLRAYSEETGAELRQVTQPPPSTPPGDPAEGCDTGPGITAWDVSPDGERVAVLRDDVGGGPGGFIVSSSLEEQDVDGGDVRVLARFEAPAPTVPLGEPIYAPDGTKLAFAARPGDGAQQKGLFVVDLTTGITTRILAREDIRGVGLWASDQQSVTFTEAPDGFSRDSTPRFAFAFPGAPAGSFECRLDRGPFGTCSSPVQVEALEDGEHTFGVRFRPSGSSPAPEVEHRWTIDTVAPITLVQQAPSGAGNGPDAEIVFSSPNEDTDRFTCGLDAEPQTTCSSPLRLTGLAPGLHRVRISAVDRAGNVETAPVELTWLVGDQPAPPPPPPAACAIPTATVGVLSAVARSADACFDRIRVDGRGALRSRGPVGVNGIQITPRGGTEIQLIEELGGGALRTTGPVTLGIGAVAIGVDRPLAWDGLKQATVAKVAALFADQLGAARDAAKEVGGLPLVAVPSLELTADNGGQTTLSLALEVPAFFQDTPGTPPPGADGKGAKGLTTTLRLTTSNDRGVTFAGRIAFEELFLFGRLRLSDVSLGLDTGEGTFEGSATMKLEQAGRLSSRSIGRDAALTTAIQLGPVAAGASPVTALRKLSVGVDKLEKHLAEGFFLQRFAGELGTGKDDAGKDAVTISGGVGLSWLPRLQFKNLFEGEVLSLDGTLKVTAALDGSSATATAEGVGKVVELPTSTAKITQQLPFGRQTVSLRQEVTAIGGVGLGYGIDEGYFDAQNLEAGLRGSATLELGPLGRVGGEIGVSTTGFAACAQVIGLRVGVSRRWAAPARPFSVLGDACDVGAFTGPAGARAAQAPGPRSVTVARGRKLLAIEVRGPGPGAPEVRVTGPDGTVLRTGERRARAFAFPSATAPVTYVLVNAPAAGTWTVSGEQPLTLRTARERPAISVRARVRKGRLRWTLRPAPGQRVVFGEESSSGGRRIVTTARASGSVRYRPAPGSARKRRITATVLQDGVPRRTLTVARVTVAPVTAGRVTKVRRGKRGEVRWTGTAPSYALSIRSASGALLLSRTVRTRTVRSRLRGRVTVTVVPLGPDGRAGRAVRAIVAL